MTSRKAKQHSHFCSPTVSWLMGHDGTTVPLGALAFCINRFRDASCPNSGLSAGRAPRCAPWLRVRSIMLRWFGGIASCPLSNRAHCRRCGQGERGEIRFSETFAWKIFLHSAASASLYGASTSPVSHSRSAPAAAIGKATSTSRARRRLPMRRSWPFSMSFVRASALDFSSGPRRNAEKKFTQSAVQPSEIEPDERLQKTRRRIDHEGGCGGETRRRHETLAGRFERSQCFVLAEGRREALISQSALVPAIPADTATAPDIPDPSVAVAVTQLRSFPETSRGAHAIDAGSWPAMVPVSLREVRRAA